MTPSLPNTLFPFIKHFLKPYKLAVFSFIFLGIMAGVWGPFNSLLMKEIINLLPRVPLEGSALLAGPGALFVLNFLIFDHLTWRTIQYIDYKFQPLIKSQILRGMFEVTLGKTPQFFQEKLSGKIANQMIMLADNIELILHKISIDFIRGISHLLISFATAYSVNPLFFYILLTWFIIFSSFSLFMSKRLVSLADTHAQKESFVSGQLVDCLANHQNVRIFSRKTYEVSRMGNFLKDAQMAFQKKEWFALVLCTGQGLLITIMIGFSIYFLIYFYKKNLLSVGDFALILSLSMELGHMMWYTLSKVDDFNKALGKCRQSLSSLMKTPPVLDSQIFPSLSLQKGQITFEKVSFHYKGNSPLFQDLSLTLEGGQKIGLVGYSGSGKSTFVSLILRLYDLQAGCIFIDGQNIREISRESLLRNIALIPQDPSLFHRSLLENIRYGKENASDEAVIEAAKRAHAHDFIMNLPRGYETMVGERGIKLSGGQRQRISIARAILKDAPILILDEATSQLDSITEMMIQESLRKLMDNTQERNSQEKTTLVIAHRLSTLLHMDRILVFDQGKIIEDGSHTELILQGGLYKTLWDNQSGGFLPDQKGEISELNPQKASSFS